MTNSHSTYDFTTCKICGSESHPTYQLRRGRVHVCRSCGFHHLDYLDECDDIDPSIDESALTDRLTEYIENQLQSSEKRFDNHIALLEAHGSLGGKKLLDIGCGGGAFLTKARDLGADAKGIELDDGRACYCRSRHQLDVVKWPIESEYWNEDLGAFDFVTLWDVIEHVNSPVATLEAASRVLKPNGVLLLDTPARDSFYHRAGVLTYRLSFGSFPTFLNSMYSSHPFGHKQILSTEEVERLFIRSCLEPLTIETFHELSFPCEFYLVKLLRSETLARFSAPLASLFFKVFRIKNKMVAAGRRIGT